MADKAVLEPKVSKVSKDSESPPETDKNKVLFEHKLPGVWGKVYASTSKEGKPAVYARFQRYRKTEDGYDNNSFINSMTDCDSAIEVLYEVKKFMRSFYGDRDRS